MPHQPVLYQEVLYALKPSSGGFYVDGTLGAGGHSYGILEGSSPEGKLLGIDRDPEAIQIARERLAPFQNRFFLVHGTYRDLHQHLNNLDWNHVDGILVDLGLSSMQLDLAGRGFSFREKSPLDMRFDPASPLTAADIVNTYPVDDLANLIYRYGEERKSRKIADLIAAHRPLKTAAELANLIQNHLPASERRIHPATRTFQALRIAVNDELGALEAFLPAAVESLKEGGRLVVISFHSLEDRIVKHYFRQESKDCICPPEVPVCVCDHKARVKIITRRPIRPEDTEIKQNPRSRSAKMRIAEKIKA